MHLFVNNTLSRDKGYIAEEYMTEGEIGNRLKIGGHLDTRVTILVGHGPNLSTKPCYISQWSSVISYFVGTRKKCKITMLCYAHTYIVTFIAFCDNGAEFLKQFKCHKIPKHV